MDIVISKKMIDERQAIKTTDLIKKIIVPCKFIFAGNAEKYKIRKPFLTKIKVKHDSISIT